MKAEIRILMADDHPVYREGLRQIISTDPVMKILRETGNGTEALLLARELKPHIALLDMDMPGMNGLDVARARKKDQLSFEIIFLTMYRERDMFNEAMDLGAKGYVLKDSAAGEILQSIRAVAAGDYYISPAISGLLVSRTNRSAGAEGQKQGLDTLTPAERRILKLIASDKTSKEIAEELGLSPRTVENHRTNMSAKLGLQGSHSLLKFAFENKNRL
ncbi:MAG: response regulator transcription factor [Verrucomicrobiales bacterium]|nr:response regulator transcription factor [Verrucomicrobiales bacterium]